MTTTMTDTDVSGRLYLPVYRLNRGGKMVTELGRRTFETEDGARQVPRGPFVPKPIEVVDVVEIVYPPAALSAAEATSAPVSLPASAGVCAYDRDECTVTIALDSETEVMALTRALPGKNRVRLCDEATSAPTPAPVSASEREELAKWHDRQAKFRKNTDADTAAMHARTATALRTPHGLPGEEELVLLMRQNLSVDVSNYGLSADIEGIEDAARAILSRLTASREDVK